jgi:hypothetical protein
VPEVVTDPEVPAAARHALEQAPVSFLVGFSDPVPAPGSPAAKAARPPGMPGARYVLASSLAAAVALVTAGLILAQPALVVVALLMCLPVAVVSALLGYGDGEPGQNGRQGREAAGAAVTYHRRYVVPALDLHDAAMRRWRRARVAASTIQTSEAVRRGLIDTVEITAVLPYHLWDIAERLALLAGPERRLPEILHGLDTSDAEIMAVLAPQRRVHDLAITDIEARISRLEEFAALAAAADTARRRQRAAEELAALNPDYEELLSRLGEPANALTVAGSTAAELRAVAAEADDAVRRANEAGRALVLPAEPGREGSSGS